MKRIKISGSCAVLAAFFLLAVSSGVSADTIALRDYNLENRIPIDGDSWSAITDTEISIGESYPAGPTSEWAKHSYDISPEWLSASNSLMLDVFEKSQPNKSNTSSYTIIDSVTFSGDKVPIPPAAWLLGSGLIGMVILRRKFK